MHEEMEEIETQLFFKFNKQVINQIKVIHHKIYDQKQIKKDEPKRMQVEPNRIEKAN